VSIARRLGKLEDAAAARSQEGCSTCQGWALRVRWENDWQTPAREPNYPAVCPDCGREPMTFSVVYGAWPPGNEPA
jgi:hypothetical protein